MVGRASHFFLTAVAVAGRSRAFGDLSCWWLSFNPSEKYAQVKIKLDPSFPKVREEKKKSLKFRHLVLGSQKDLAPLT